MIDELNQYYPVTNDIEVLKKQREDYMFVNFFQGLVLYSNQFEATYKQEKGRFPLCRILFMTISGFRIFYSNFNLSLVEKSALIFLN